MHVQYGLAGSLRLYTLIVSQRFVPRDKLHAQKTQLTPVANQKNTTLQCCFLGSFKCQLHNQNQFLVAPTSSHGPYGLIFAEILPIDDKSYNKNSGKTNRQPDGLHVTVQLFPKSDLFNVHIYICEYRCRREGETCSNKMAVEHH